MAGLLSAVGKIARAGELLYGDLWVGPLARAIGVAPRTLNRVRAASFGGPDANQADGALLALCELLERLGAIINETESER